MKLLLSCAVLLGVAVLSGCSTMEPAAEQGALASAETQQASAPSIMTGSRIPNRPTSERTLKMVGNTDYRDSVLIKSLGNETAKPGM